MLNQKLRLNQNSYLTKNEGLIQKLMLNQKLRFNQKIVKSLCLVIFFTLISSLAACGDGDKKALKIQEDPFLTLGENNLSAEKIQQYKQRQITQESYQKILVKVEETQQQVKQQGSHFSYQSINFNEKTSSVDIKGLEVSGDLLDPLTVAIKDFKDTKNLSINWYDNINDIPHFMKASMHDNFVPNEEFLKTADGKAMVDFFTKLGVDPKQLDNWSDIVYDFEEKQGKVALALNNDFNKLINLRLVTKLDSFSKQMYKILGDTKTIQNPAMLLGLLSSIRLEEVYLKIKLEKTIEEIFSAMPEKDAQEARKNYNENKNMSDAEIKKYIGNGYSAEQVKQYRETWLNFLEHKKPLIISIKPDIPLAFSALFSGAMMAQQSSKMAESFIEQLKLTISN